MCDSAMNTEVVESTRGVHNVLTKIKFIISANVFDDGQNFQVSKMIFYFNPNAADETVWVFFILERCLLQGFLWGRIRVKCSTGNALKAKSA